VPLSLRSAGHGISGRSTNDGGIVLDVSRLARIEVVDEATRRVRVGPGARWGQVARALYPHGWALTSGDYGGVGVGGLATTGGIGFLGREQGLTIDHVRAVQMVLADGSVVHASPTEHPDLFWGARGAGFMLGIVTDFEFEVGVAGDVGFAILAFDATDTAGFLQRWGETVEASPRDTTSFLVAGAPQSGRTIVQLVTVVDSDDPDVVLARLQPFAGIAPLVGQSAQIVPYPAVVGLPEPSQDGYGEPVTRAGFVEHITPEVAATTANLIHSGEAYFFQIRAVGGAVNDVDPDATAYAHRSVNFAFSAFGRSRRRLDERWDAMGSLFRGLYPSFETDPRPERVLDAYPPRTLARLQAVKRRYDPEHVFADNFDVARPDLPVVAPVEAEAARPGAGQGDVPRDVLGTAR
jgi:FAD/FMN-containing dehydrogenase